MKQLLVNDKQQVVANGNPYLCKDCILRRSEERLDVQVLLDPLEEQLNLPALPIKLCYSERINDEIVRPRVSGPRVSADYSLLNSLFDSLFKLFLGAGFS